MRYYKRNCTENLDCTAGGEYGDKTTRHGNLALIWIGGAMCAII